MENDSKVPTLFELYSRELVHAINWQNPSKEVEKLKNKKLCVMDLERIAHYLTESQPQPVKRPDLHGLIAATRDKLVLEKQWYKIFSYIHIVDPVDPNNSQKGIWISKPRNCTAVAISPDNSHYAFKTNKKEVIFGETSSWSGPITTYSDYEDGLNFINHDTFWTRDFVIKWKNNHGFYNEEINKKRWLDFLPTKKESIPSYARGPVAISPNQEFKALLKFMAVGSEGQPLFKSSIITVCDHDPEFIIPEEWALAKKEHKFKKELSHEEPISTLAFDSESKLLLACSNNHLYLWDFKQSYLVAKLPKQNDPNSGWWSNKLLWWSPDYESVIIKHSNGTIFSVDFRPTILAYYLTKQDVGERSN